MSHIKQILYKSQTNVICRLVGMKLEGFLNLQFYITTMSHIYYKINSSEAKCFNVCMRMAQ